MNELLLNFTEQSLQLKVLRQKLYWILDRSWYWIKAETGLTWWWHITHHSRCFIFSPVFCCPEHFPYRRSCSKRYCLEMLLKAVWENSSSPVSRIPCSGCPSLGLWLCATLLWVSQAWLAKLPWSNPAEKAFSLPHKEDGPWRAEQLEGESVWHCGRDTVARREALQLPLKRFLVQANNISDAKGNEGKCSDLVAELAWMELIILAFCRPSKPWDNNKSTIRHHREDLYLCSL